MAARAIAVADVSDALIADRPYRPRGPEHALGILAAESGSHVAGDVVAALRDTCNSRPRNARRRQRDSAPRTPGALVLPDRRVEVSSR